MNRIKVVFITAICIFSNYAFSQNSSDVKRTLKWNNSLQGSVNKTSQLSFDDCYFDITNNITVPVYYERIPVNSQWVRASVTDIQYAENTIEDALIESVAQQQLDI